MCFADRSSPYVCSPEQSFCCDVRSFGLGNPGLLSTGPLAQKLLLSHTSCVLRAPLLFEGFNKLCSLLGKKNAYDS